MPIKIRVIDKINIFIWNRTMLHYRRWTLIYVNVLVRRLTECDIKMLVLFWTHWKILWSKFPNMNLRYIPHWNVYQGQFWNIDEHFFFSQMKENMLSPLTIVKFSSHVSSKCIRLSFYIFEILLTSLFGIWFQILIYDIIICDSTWILISEYNLEMKYYIYNLHTCFKYRWTRTRFETRQIGPYGGGGSQQCNSL